MADRRSKGARLLADWIGDRSQREVAELLGVTPAVLSRWLSGQREPGTRDLFMVEDVTGGAVPARSWVT